MRITIYLFSFLFFSLSAQAQIFDDPDLKREAWVGIDQIYNLDFEKAHSSFLQLQSKYPDSPAAPFLMAVNRWWQTFMSETMEKFYGDIHGYLAKAIELNAVHEEDEAFELEFTYLQFMIYALDAKVYAAEGEWWKAANTAKKVLPNLKDGFDFTERQAEFFFSSGLYHYYAETYPKQHILIKPFMIFFPSGDMELGLKEMEIAGQSRNYAQIECLFYLGDIYLDELGNYEEGLRIVQKLAELYPRNTWFQADHAHGLLLNGQYAEANEILDDLIAAYEQQAGHDSRNITSLQSRFTTHLMTKVYHYKGKSRFLSSRFNAEAKSLFEKSMAMAALVGVEEDDLLAADVYYIGRCYDSMGQRSKAEEHYKKALKMDQNVYIKDDIKACLKEACK